MSGIIDEIESSDLIFIGELHDEPFHHSVQIEIIKKLHEQGAEISIGLEMFRADNQKFLNKIRRKSPSYRFVVILPESEKLSRDEATTSQADYLFLYHFLLCQYGFHTDTVT